MLREDRKRVMRSGLVCVCVLVCLQVRVWGGWQHRGRSGAEEVYVAEWQWAQW